LSREEGHGRSPALGLAIPTLEGGLRSRDTGVQRETLERFTLPSSGTAANTAAALVGEGILVRVETAPGQDFESPFFRGWVVSRALPDLGVEGPVTWRATLGR